MNYPIEAMRPEASYPYAGTSGHSGSDTSRERAERDDSSGTTASRQERVLALMLLPPRQHGITVKELREDTGMHHGQASSALSCLHKDGKISRLKERRDRCAVYVLPEYVGGRETAAQGRESSKAREDKAYKQGYEDGVEQRQADQFEAESDANLQAQVAQQIVDQYGPKVDYEQIVADISTYLAKRSAIPSSVAWIEDVQDVIAKGVAE